MMMKGIYNLWNRISGSSLHIFRSMELAWNASPIWISLIVLLNLLSALLPLALAYVGKRIVDALLAHEETATVRWIVWEFGIFATQALVARLLIHGRTLLSNKLEVATCVKILTKSIGLELSQFENSVVYDKLSLAWRESPTRPALMVNDTLLFLQNGLTFFGYITLLISYNFWAALGLALSSFPAALSEAHFSGSSFRLQNWRSPERRKLSYLEYLLTNDQHAKEVRLFGLGPFLLERYESKCDFFYQEDKKVCTKRTAWGFGLSILSIIFLYGCYGAMAISAATGQMTLGNLTLYVIAFRQGHLVFQSCLTALTSVYEHNLYMSNLFAFLSLPSPVPPQPAEIPISVQPAHQGFTFEKVSFRYPEHNDWALRNINLVIDKNQSVALVGKNGAGKTSLMKLICRFYDPTEGRILLDGIDLRAWDRHQLWDRYSVVFQDFNRYHFSLGENIGLGDIAQLQNEAKIREAIEQSGASLILESLPEGTQTQLGSWFPAGVELSGGQWQRVALSRAFMRGHSDILILDEPTAALDAQAERDLLCRFETLSRGKTSFIISHCLPTARLAGRIIVLENGEISEDGTHEELFSAGGLYRQLLSLQAERYQTS